MRIEISFVRRDRERVPAICLGNGLLRPVPESDRKAALALRASAIDSLFGSLYAARTGDSARIVMPSNTPIPNVPVTERTAYDVFAAMSFMRKVEPKKAEPPTITYNRQTQQVVVSGGSWRHTRLERVDDEWFVSPGVWCGKDRSWKRHRSSQFK